MLLRRAPAAVGDALFRSHALSPSSSLPNPLEGRATGFGVPNATVVDDHVLIDLITPAVRLEGEKRAAE